MRFKLTAIVMVMTIIIALALCFSVAFAEGTQVSPDNRGSTMVGQTAGAPAKGSGDSDAELLKKSQNPVSNLISLPVEYDYGSGNGTTNKILWIKPVIPASISEKWNLVTRALIDYQSLKIDNFASAKSFGNGNITFFFSPKKPAKFMWGAGPMFQVPMANTTLFGSNKLGLGPSAVGVITEGPWVVGLLANNVWGVGNGTGELNQATFQPFVNYNMAKKWFLFTAPDITADWTAVVGNKWTVPLGAGVGKMINIGHQPLVLSAAYYKNIKRPDRTYDWQFQLVMKFLFPE